MKSVSIRLSAYIEAKKIKQIDIAEVMGKKRQIVSSIINGRSNLTLEQCILLHKKYHDLNIYWLLFGEGEMLNKNINQQNKQTGDGNYNINSVDSDIVNDKNLNNYSDLKELLKQKDKIIEQQNKLIDSLMNK